MAGLLRDGFLTRTDGLIALANSSHAALFRRIATRFDLEKLLPDSKEAVALALLTAENVRDIQRQTGLSYETVKRALNKMMETGAVREKDGSYSLADDEELRLFLRLWKEEKQKRLVEPYATVVYEAPDLFLKRVPEGKNARGALTAFSVFGRYGVRLRPAYAYYVQPEREVSIEEVLVHAIVFSKDPVELTDCAVFYAKNRHSIDVGRVRTIARRYGVADLVIDLENYIQNSTISAPERFLPWSEFAEKLRLYGVSPEGLLPTAFPDFVEQLSRIVKREVRIYVFGGEAMRGRGLKRATKDIDVVVGFAKDFATLKEALISMGYRALGENETTTIDRKSNPSGIFVKEGFPRVDIYTEKICNAFYLSSSMKKRCDVRRIENLSVCTMSNEDIFLLKSVTDREGDLYDMIQLAKAVKFDWRVVLDELYNQELKTGGHFCLSLLLSVEDIEERANVRAPILDQLRNHWMEQAIIEAVRLGATTLTQVRESVDYPDYRLRTRISKLVRQGKLERRDHGKLALRP